jgi:Phosphotransferase enzyme family
MSTVADQPLRAVVEGLLTTQLATSVRATSVSREPSRFAGVSPAEVVTVGLENGDTFALFVKHLGPEQSDHPDKLRRDREPNVYRRLFAGRDLPVPRFYGSRWNPESHRNELFLEHIDDWNLKYHGLEHWTTAARRLADFHSCFASKGDELAQSDFLLRLDSTYFRAWAARSLAAVGTVSARAARKLERILRRHDVVADLLSSQPQTLVHNDLAPKNVIAETSANPARICLVDWEMAGVGCGLLDLVHLKHGLSARDEQLVCAAYCTGLAGMGLIPSGRALSRLLAACELQNTLYRLAHIEAWRLERETVERWIEDVRHLRTAV